MRPDDINPRTGLVVALVSVFLVFGFMFTVSGIKGETLGDIPLLAIGPAICLPGIAAIALTRKTDGCSKWPENRCCPTGRCCRKKAKDYKDVLELLRTPSELESGKCSSSDDELAKRAGAPAKAEGEAGGGYGGSSGGAAEGEHNSLGQIQKVQQEEMLRYLEECYPDLPGNVFVAEATPYGSAVEQKEEEEPPALEGASSAAAPWPEAEDNMFAAPPQDSVIVCSYKASSPYDRYCCYINPSEEISSDQDETII